MESDDADFRKKGLFAGYSGPATPPGGLRRPIGASKTGQN